MKKTIQILIIIAIVLSQENTVAQYGTTYNQRDDQYTLLGLKRAKEAYEIAKAELERKREMLSRNLISQGDFDQIKRNFSEAEVNYQQSILAVLFEKQYVSVKNAVKYQAADGRKHVRLTLANSSGGSAEFKKLLGLDEYLFRALRPEVINDVYVSLLNSENAIISQPYEAKIEELMFGKPVTIDFALLQDLDAVVVDLIYGRGNQRSPKIYLQKDASENKVIVQSEQFSQEAELGNSASFGLTLELFSGTDNTFKLEVVNLPQQLNRYFIDPVTQARLSQFKFTERTNTRGASLNVFLPDRPTDELKIDKPIPFYVLVIPRDQLTGIENLQSKIWTQKEIEKLGVGFVKLELVPRGIGKLLVRAPQLFYSIQAEETVTVPVELVNEGTRQLNNVEIKIDAPLNWQKSVNPEVLPVLEIGAEKQIHLKFTPPKDVSVGRYEFRIQTTSLSDNKPVNGEDKTVTVEIQAGANILSTFIIILLVLGVIVGIVIFGIKLTRK